MNQSLGLPHADAAMRKHGLGLRMSRGGSADTRHARRDAANGSRAQAVLTSILCTARQQDQDVFALLTDLLRSPQPKLLNMVPEVPAESQSGWVGVGRAAETAQPERDAEAEMMGRRFRFCRTGCLRQGRNPALVPCEVP